MVDEPQFKQVWLLEICVIFRVVCFERAHNKNDLYVFHAWRETVVSRQVFFEFFSGEICLSKDLQFHRLNLCVRCD